MSSPVPTEPASETITSEIVERVRKPMQQFVRGWMMSPATLERRASFGLDPAMTPGGTSVGDAVPRAGMVPPASLLPDVLPTERLNRRAMAQPPLRAELRRIRNGRSALAVVCLAAQVVLIFAGAIWLAHPLGYVVAFVLLGRVMVCCNILGHEAVHRTLFSNQRVNDWVGRWLLSYPALVAFELYRRGHMAHHRDEMGPAEPDLALYRGYPITRASLRRKLVRDASGVSGWKILKDLLRGLGKARSRPVAAKIVAVQVLMVAVATLFGRPELYLLWLGPYLTQWRVANRLRAIAEHGGMIRSADRRETTHLVRQGPLARFFMVPYHVGLHLAHHVDMGVPCWNLPRLQRELEASGWVPSALIYPSYRSLWSKLSSRAPSAAPVAAGVEV
ncbi:MAG: fatty acid desaturase family protein [Acidimicrobiales bacterium]